MTTTAVEQVSGPASAVGLRTVDRDGGTLDVLYPAPQLGADFGGSAAGRVLRPAEATEAGGSSLAGAIGSDDLRAVRTEAVAVTIDDLSQPPTTVEDAYLRLHLLSHRLVLPNTINLAGIFGVLPNNAWTTIGPIAPARLTATLLQCRARATAIAVTSVDKFPRMTDYVVPSAVRIADADRVRLGAYLAAGTTVMHEGFVNYNAGTLGQSMVEGRISQGVVVGDGTDIGGGASIMGTLSGGGTEVIRLGERCLLGANAGLGISLGNDCVVEAGLYITAGTVITTPDGERHKAREMSGIDGILLRRNSVSGAIEALPTSGTWQGLNTALHAN